MERNRNLCKLLYIFVSPLLKRANQLITMLSSIKSQAEARVTLQEIRFLFHFKVSITNMPHYFFTLPYTNRHNKGCLQNDIKLDFSNFIVCVKMYLKCFSGLLGEKKSMEEMATRIAFEMEKNTTSWVLSTAAGLYWRVKGRASEAVSCLRQRYFQLLKN